MTKNKPASVEVAQTERDAIARIIDPEAWVSREIFQEILAGTNASSNPATEAMRIRSATRRVDAVVADSLTKADAIIARPPDAGMREALEKIDAILKNGSGFFRIFQIREIVRATLTSGDKS